MRRFAPLGAVIIVLMIAGAPPAAATEPAGTCPPAASGFVLHPINNPNWTPASPVPGPGEEPTWDLTVAGLVEAFGSVEAAATALGFGSVSDLYAFVLAILLNVDMNDDAFICVRPFPEVSQIAPYFFNVIDNRAHVPG